MNRRTTAIMAIMILSGATMVVTSRASAQTITEFPVPATSTGPGGITSGPDGALWITLGTSIGRMTTAGVVTTFGIPSTQEGAPIAEGITTGPDGALWFTDYGLSKIGRMTTAGVVTEYPTASIRATPEGITTGPDGALWFTEKGVNKIGRMTTAGIATEFAIPSGNSGVNAITKGPDGALWFTEMEAAKIGRITTDGVVTEYTIPSRDPRGPGSYPKGITTGPDGALWFTESFIRKIGRITTAGAFTEYELPYSRLNREPQGITSGPDGALWFYEQSAIGRITTAGVITEVDRGQSPFSTVGTGQITTGPDNAFWFTEGQNNQAGRLLPATASTVSLEFNGHRDGTGSYARAAEAPDLNLSTHLTLEARVYWSGTNGYLGVLSKPRHDSGNSSGTGYTLALTDGKPILGIITASGANRSGATARTPIAANVWTSVAMSYDGQRSITYVNGAEIAREDWQGVDGVAPGTTGVLIGREFLSQYVDRAFGGRLADVRIWNQTLPAETIAAWRDKASLNGHPNESSLVARWLLNDGEGGVAKDSSGHGHDATLADGAAWHRSP